MALHSVQSLASGLVIPWELNKIIEVEDDFADINEQLLVNSIRWKESIGSGSTTILGLVRKDAYSQELSNPTLPTVGSSTGGSFGNLS